jgi:PAS domain S-box-containing protein
MTQESYQALLKALPTPVMVMKADQTISFINPAFEKTFGWTLEEIKGQPLAFIPEDQLLKTATGKVSLVRKGELSDFETQRFTKDGRLLDVIYDGARIYDADNRPSGLIITLKDITQTKRAEFINRSLYQISNALHSYHSLDDLLNYISQQTRSLLGAGRAHVMLLDERDETFSFRAEDVDDTESVHRYTNLKISANRGVTGEVYRTRKPVVVNDYANSPLAAGMRKHLPDHRTRSLVQVPIFVEQKLIGILGVVNKKIGDFDEKDVTLLTTIAGVVGLPIENARINNELYSSYREIKSLNKAKDSIIDRLSHELRTPLAIIRASLHMLAGSPSNAKNETSPRILQRAENNLNRLLEMQYQLEDITQHSNPSHYAMHSKLLDLCTEELESLVLLETGEPVGHRIRDKIDSIFGPREAVSQSIELGAFVNQVLKRIKAAFSHRSIDLLKDMRQAGNIYIPSEVLEKIIVGLVKNAVENTPDGGNIEIQLKRDANRVILNIGDSGIGITEENKQLLFNNFFTTSETYNYSTRKPYDFNAGGRGFELLRIKIFSERYNFKIDLTSNRCPFIPTDKDFCPGKTTDCRHLADPNDCLDNGGTIFSIQFTAKD